MKKPVVYAGIAALFIIALGLAVYMTVSTHAPNVDSSNKSTNATGAMTNKTLNWEITGNGTISNIFLGDDGTLYAVMGDKGNDIYAMNLNGSVKWSLTIPDKWRVRNPLSRPINGFSPGHLNYNGPVLSSENGTLYLYIREDNNTWQDSNFLEDTSSIFLYHMGMNYNPYAEERLLAISPEGKVIWNRSIGTEHHTFEDVNLIAKNDNVYVFDSYTETVFNESGSELFKIRGISSPASVDENGFLYVVPGQPHSLPPYVKDGGVYMEPTSIVEAYYPNGTLSWRKDMEEPIPRIERAGLPSKLDTLPLYQNRTLYVPVNNGIFALHTNGSVKWSKHYKDEYNKSYGYFGEALPYWYLPIDDRDNLYMLVDYQFKTELHVISPDGQEKITNGGTCTYCDPKDGIHYDAWCFSPYDVEYKEINGTMWRITTLDDLLYSNITAYDIFEGMLWSYTIVPNKTYTVITSDNAKKKLSIAAPLNSGVVGINVFQQSNGGILPGKDIVYVNYWSACYEMPIIVNKSKCAYSSKIIALDKMNGTLLWEKSLDSFVTSMAVNNNTIYYGTKDGQLASGGLYLQNSN